MKEAGNEQRQKSSSDFHTGSVEQDFHSVFSTVVWFYTFT